MQALLELYSTEKCSLCNNDFYQQDLIAVDNLNIKVCKNCMNENLIKCDNCGTTVYIDDAEFYGTIGFCAECFKQKYFRCFRCTEVFIVREMRVDPNNYTRRFCEDCFMELFTTCDLCGIPVLIETTTIQRNGDAICPECYNRYYARCTWCGETIQTRHSLVVGYRDGRICQSCHEKIENATIKPYFYKRDVKFYGNPKDNIHYGFEIEAENYGMNINEDIADLINNDLFYCKGDGSLNNGFEVVSQPMSFEYINGIGRKKINSMLKKLRSNRMRSSMTNTCGMHVHISKKPISNLSLYKILKLFYENENFIFKVSRRNMESFQDFSSLSDDQSLTEKALSKRSYDRYIAVNLMNENTIEIRIFKGTLKQSSFYANLEFCHAMIKYCEQESIMRVSPKNFIRYINNKRKLYPNLYNFLNNGRFICV
jgi:hypothetical protein